MGSGELIGEAVNKLKRAVIYARVSTDEQAEHGYSLPSQIDACRKYAQANGLIVVAEFQDDFTGAKLDRPEFSKVREMVRLRQIDALIVYCADRLTRNLAHSLILRDEFEHAKIERHYAMRGRSENTPENRMLENIEGVFAEYEREKIRERMARGKMQKAASGRFVGNGKVPYGYRREGDKLITYEPEAAIVAKIYDAYLNGVNGKQMSLRGIARWLSDSGIPTPAESGQSNHRRKSKYWNAFTVRLILDSEMYTGTYRYGRYIGYGGKGGQRPIENRVAISIPAIIDRTTWERAGQQLKQNKHFKQNNALYNYLLRGFITCGKCEHAICGAGRRDWRDKGKLRGYYRCSQGSHRRASAQDTCKMRYLPAQPIEEEVWNFVLEVLTGEGFERRLRLAQEQEVQALAPKLEELERTKRLITECELEANNLTATMAKLNSPLFSKTIQEQVEMLERRNSSLMEAQAELEATISAMVVTDEQIAVALQFRDEVNDGLAAATVEDKRRYITHLQASVVVNDSKATVTLRIPKQSREIDLEFGSTRPTNQPELMSAMIGISPLPWPPCSQSRRW